ncbi:MAG: hypothetical protein ABI321_01725 [Polyangia bacterium]
MLLCAVGAAHATGRCDSSPPDADWFYLGAPRAPYQREAQLTLDAITRAFDPELFGQEPRCLRITVLGKDALDARSLKINRHERNRSGMVGFHSPTLGADNTVFVTPNGQIPLEVVMTHEVLHALSHRFSKEASRRRLVNLVEGSTDYLARELAVLMMGKHRDSLHSAYDGYVRFFQELMKRLGDEGPRLLADCYLRDGYLAFETAVDRTLGVSLGRAAQRLEHDDLRGALLELDTSDR